MIYKVLRCLTPPVRGMGFSNPRGYSQTEIITVGIKRLPWRKNVVPVKLSANGSHVTPFFLGVKRLRCTAVLFQPSFQPCEIHITTFLHNMTCDVHTPQKINAIGVLSGGTNMFEKFLSTDE